MSQLHNLSVCSIRIFICISANYMDNWKNIGIIKADGSLAHTIPSSPQQQSLPAFQQPLPPQPPFMTNFSAGVAASAKSSTWLKEVTDAL